MRRETSITFEFVEFIPTSLKEGNIYVSIPYATVVHKCICGCGNEVVTPLSPTDWKLIFDGETISLDPSIGNWSFKCQSHYWVKRNKVIWTGRWTQNEINAGRNQDRLAKEKYFGPTSVQKKEAPKENRSIWQKLLKWLS